MPPPLAERRHLDLDDTDRSRNPAAEEARGANCAPRGAWRAARTRIGWHSPPADRRLLDVFGFHPIGSGPRRGGRNLLLPTRTYSYQLYPQCGVAYQADELHISSCGGSWLLLLTLSYSDLLSPTLPLRGPGIPMGLQLYLVGTGEGVVLGRVVGAGAVPREDPLVDEAPQDRPCDLATLTLLPRCSESCLTVTLPLT